MNEHERIDYIKKETDATPIPESLEPEHIREQLSTGTSTTDTATTASHYFNEVIMDIFCTHAFDEFTQVACTMNSRYM